MKRNTAAREIARFGLLAALALVLGYAEQWIPAVPGVPGIKLGLANTVLLYAVYMASPGQAVLLMLTKVLLSGFLYAGVSAMLYSLAGGALSLAVMLAVSRLPKSGIVGVSVCGAAAHNVGQLCAAALALGTGAVWGYLPILLVSAAVMGVVTGTAAGNVFSALARTGGERSFRIRPRPLRESRRRDLLTLGAVLLAAGVCALTLSLAGGSNGEYLEVMQNGRTRWVIPMSEYGVYRVESASGGENVFVIDENGAHMLHASCPDGLCVGQGTVTANSLLPITCLPNRLTLQVVERSAVPEDFDWTGQDYAALRTEE